MRHRKENCHIFWFFSAKIWLFLKNTTLGFKEKLQGSFLSLKIHYKSSRSNLKDS